MNGTPNSPQQPLALPRKRHILPGFRLTMGFTLFYLSVMVLIPVAALVLKVFTPTEDYPTFRELLAHVWRVTTDDDAMHSYLLSFGLSFAAALINGFFGLIGAWALTRYRFPGRRIIDALVDLPFAMPTAVAGIALTQIFTTNGGYIGEVLNHAFGWKIAYTPVGILMALIFIGFPFVVRTLQPVLVDLPVEVEEAAACLGANRWQTFRRIILPAVRPALIPGMMLAFGRAVGEYGSVVFIAGNIPFYTQITPQLIIQHLDEYDYVGAAGLGFVMLLVSFVIVAAVNIVQLLAVRRKGKRG